MEKLLVIGSLNMDYVLNVENMPRKGETVLCGDFSMVPGGKGANQAFAAGRLGAQVTMLGAVGQDAAGEALCQSLSGAGVDVSRILRCEGVPTGSAFIPVDSQGENCIIVAQGANGRVDIPYIDRNLDALEACGMVLLQLEIPLETVVYAAQKAKALGKTVILDPAPARRDIPRELFAVVDYIKPNETELGILLGDESAWEDPNAAAESLQAMGVGNVLLTLGEKGAFLRERDGGSDRCPAHKVPVVDTTAAGDSFTAAFAAALARGEQPRQAVRYAAAVSGIVVTRKGAQTSIPSGAEVEEYMNRMGPV